MSLSNVSRRLRWLLLAAILLLALPTLPAPAAEAQSGSRTFPETGMTVSGKFLQYWNNHGGLAQQGYPISNQIQEVSDTNGQTYTVQYFERAVFEYHPENPVPNDILLSLLGVFFYQQKYPGGAPAQQANSSAGSVLFPQTGHRVGGLFLSYWKGHGGLAQQGYPISDEFVEISGTDGQPYAVQYFERAVFEYHPEKPAPNNVLLSLLGTFRYQARYGTTNPNPNPGGGLGSFASLQDLMDESIYDINAFWEQTFAAANVEYYPPDDIKGYTAPIQTPCGVTKVDNASHCHTQDGFTGLYYDLNLMQRFVDQVGNVAPAVAIAHEWGHHVQYLIGLSGTQSTIKSELQADCLAGVWAVHAGAGGRIQLEPGDLEKGANVLFSLGSSNSPWNDPSFHGLPEQRYSAFEEGVKLGLDWCLNR